MGAIAAFQCVALGLLKHGVNSLCLGFPVGDIAHEIVRGWWDQSLKDQDPQHRQGELESLANLSAQATRDAVQTALAAPACQAELDALASPQDRAAAIQQVAAYLEQIPPTIRQISRRPADPTGRTVPPRLAPRQASDLAAFLPERPALFQPGHVVGDWELQDLLGQGGFGEVWLARGRYLKSQLGALKFARSKEAIAELRHSAALLDRVQTQRPHPGIVVLQNTHLSADPPYLVYEHIPGGELTGLIRQWHGSDGGQTLEQAELERLSLRYFHSIVSAVAHAHALPNEAGQIEPLVHRDLKPANILLSPAGDRSLTKVADFGIGGFAARRDIAAERSGKTTRDQKAATALRGAYTVVYASPEQVNGGEPDPRDDVHALGVILYQMLTGDLGNGVPPDWQEELTQREVSAETMALLRACVASSAKRRLPDAGAILERLQPDASPFSRAPEARRREARGPQRAGNVSDGPALAPSEPNAQATTPPLPHGRGSDEVDDAAALQAKIIAERRRQVAARIVREETERAEAERKAQAKRQREEAEAARQAEKAKHAAEAKRGQAEAERRRRQEAARIVHEEEVAKFHATRKPPIELDLGTGGLFDAIFGGGKLKALWIPPGPFPSGSDTQLDVARIDQGFHLGVTSVTQAQWHAVMGTMPWKGKPYVKEGANFPATYVHASEAQQFCHMVKTKTGVAARLPTEAEWEYACRAGTKTAYSFGDDEVKLAEHAWYDKNASDTIFGKYAHKVGKKKPNPWGLYDMHGNVWEWCTDNVLLGSYLLEGFNLRGGSWNLNYSFARSACRNKGMSNDFNAVIGFRVVLVGG